MPTYTYRVVSDNGSGIYSSELPSIRAAKQLAEKLMLSQGKRRLELERVSHPTPGSSRYWMRRGSRWVLWNAHEDMDARNPDMKWVNE